MWGLRVQRLSYRGADPEKLSLPCTLPLLLDCHPESLMLVAENSKSW